MPGAECDGVGISLISLTVPHDFDFVDFVSVFWSLVPYAILGVFCFCFIFTQRLSMLVLVVFGLISAALNEFIIKQVHEEDRPPKSCLDSGAFPSGHASIAVLYLVWLTLETIVHPGWSKIKKFIIIVGVWILFGPCGPFRKVVNDHTWFQIGIGMACGAFWGLVSFLFTRFVILRFIEDLMCTRLFKWLHIRNDLRPAYDESRHKGSKVPDLNASNNVATNTTPAEKPRIKSFVAASIFIIVINILLGGAGILTGLLKDHDGEDCDRSSPGVAIAVGALTAFTAIFFMIPVTLLTVRKLKGHEWFPELVQALLFIGGLFLLEAFFWNVATIETSTEDDNCPPNRTTDETLVYGIVWFAVEGVLLLLTIIVTLKIDLRKIYGFKKTLLLKNKYTQTNKAYTSSQISKRRSNKNHQSTKSTKGDVVVPPNLNNANPPSFSNAV